MQLGWELPKVTRCELPWEGASEPRAALLEPQEAILQFGRRTETTPGVWEEVKRLANAPDVYQFTCWMGEVLRPTQRRTTTRPPPGA